MKIVEFYIDLREGTVRTSAAIAHPNTYSWRVRRTQAGFFGGLLELRFRDRELWRKGTETRLVASIAAKTQNKSIAGQKGVFFSSTSKEKRWIYLYGFWDVYWLFFGLRVSKEKKEVSLTLFCQQKCCKSTIFKFFLKRIIPNSFKRRKIQFYIKQKCVNCKNDPLRKLMIFKYCDITMIRGL